MFRLIAALMIAAMPIISVSTGSDSSGFGSRDVDILDDWGCETATCGPPPPFADSSQFDGFASRTNEDG